MGRAKLRKLRPLAEPQDGSRQYSDEDIETIIKAVGSLPDEPMRRDHVDRQGIRSLQEWDRRAELVDRLELEAAGFRLERGFEEAPPPSSVHAELQAIYSSSNRLLKALRSISEGRGGKKKHVAMRMRYQMQDMAETAGGFEALFPGLGTKFQMRGEPDFYPDYRPDVMLRRCLGAVWLLRSAARRAAYNEQQQIGDSPGHQGDVALRGFIAALKCIYKDVFKKEPATSYLRPAPGKKRTSSGPFIRFADACLRPLGIKLSPDSIRELARPRRARRGMGKSGSSAD